MTDSPHALRPADRRPRPGHPRARARRAGVPAAAAHGRPDARRSATRCSTSGSSPASATCGRPRAASRPGSTRGGAPATSPTRRRCAIVHATRPRMQESARDGMQERFKVVYGTAGQPCPRCGEASNIRCTRAGRRQPDDILVPTMSAMRRIGHKGADLIVPGNTPASFDAALAHGVDMIEFDVLPEHQHDAGDGPPAARARLRARRRRADARGGPRPPRVAARSTASSSTSTSSSPATRSASSHALREHGLVERTLISSNWMRSLVVIRAAGAEAAARLVGPAPASSDPTQSWLTKLPAYAGAAYVRGEAAVGGQGPHGRGPLRRADGALAARLTAAGARGQRGRRRALRLDRRRRPRASAASRSSASPGSSPTTRGCSLSCRARRSRRSSPPGRRPRWSGGRPRWRPRPVRGSASPLRQRKRTTPRSVTGVRRVREAEAPAGLDRRRPWRCRRTRQPESASSTSAQCPSAAWYWTRKRIESRAPFGVPGHRRADADRVGLLGGVADVDRRPRRRVARLRPRPARADGRAGRREARAASTSGANANLAPEL